MRHLTFQFLMHPKLRKCWVLLQYYVFICQLGKHKKNQFYRIGAHFVKSGLQISMQNHFSYVVVIVSCLPWNFQVEIKMDCLCCPNTWCNLGKSFGLLELSFDGVQCIDWVNWRCSLGIFFVFFAFRLQWRLKYL